MLIGLTQRVQWLPERGERRDCLDQAWTSLLRALGFFPSPIPNRLDEVDMLFDTLDLGGVILTGGNDLEILATPRNPAPERDRLERWLINECSRRNVPLLGVCRGMQMLVTHGGGTLTPVEEHAGTSHPLQANGTLSPDIDSRDAVNSFHDYGFRREDVGDDFTAAAFAPDGTVEAVVHRRLKQWGIMWHPERGRPDQRDTLLLKQVFAEG